MKVVYVSTVDRGGPFTHLVSLAPTVAAAGVDVRVVCKSPALASLFGGDVDARAVPMNSKWDIAGALGIVAATEGAQIVHAHDPRAALLLPLVRRRSRTVYTYHGLPEDFAPMVGRPAGEHGDEVGWLRRMTVLEGRLRLEAHLANKGGLVVPSIAMAEFLAQHGFRRASLALIPYGVDVPDESAPAVASRDPAFRVGTSAVLIPRKGLDVLLDACAGVSRPLELHIYGDGPCRTALERQANDRGVNATFHGMVTDVRKRLPDLDVFVLPTRGDNLPVAVLEAMAAGLPVISTRTGGIPEMVIAGETGELVEPDDVSGLARAIDRMASDPDLRRRLGAAGRTRVAQHFEAGDVARQMIGLYEQLCGSSTSSRS